MPTVTPIDLGSVITFDSADLQSAIGTFFGIAVVPALLLLGVTWTWGPRIMRKIGGLLKRG